MMDNQGFDEGLTGSYENGLFGIPVEREQAKVIVAPIPWDATTSYGKGTSKGPEAILQASPQIDLFDFDLVDTWKRGYFWDPSLMGLENLNRKVRPLSESVMSELEQSGSLGVENKNLQNEVNAACKAMVDQVYEFTKAALDEGKLVGLVGGDHSTPEGYIRALGERTKGEFGILHIDAHHDLRESYQGFKHSHASIMHNVLKQEFAPQSLVQVGIRDFSKEEIEAADSHRSVKTFWDRKTKSRMFTG
ncbi:MAG: arginase family protein, partial [Pseudomonadota bacterium]